MSLVDNFNSAWWDMAKVDLAREALLNNEHKEVYHEMIFQECQEGIKTLQRIADEYHVHKTTVYRINKTKGRAA